MFICFSSWLYHLSGTCGNVLCQRCEGRPENVASVKGAGKGRGWRSSGRGLCASEKESWRGARKQHFFFRNTTIHDCAVLEYSTVLTISWRLVSLQIPRLYGADQSSATPPNFFEIRRIFRLALSTRLHPIYTLATRNQGLHDFCAPQRIMDSRADNGRSEEHRQVWWRCPGRTAEVLRPSMGSWRTPYWLSINVCVSGVYLRLLLWRATTGLHLSPSAANSIIMHFYAHSRTFKSNTGPHTFSTCDLIRRRANVW